MPKFIVYFLEVFSTLTVTVNDVARWSMTLKRRRKIALCLQAQTVLSRVLSLAAWPGIPR